MKADSWKKGRCALDRALVVALLCIACGGERFSSGAAGGDGASNGGDEAIDGGDDTGAGVAGRTSVAGKTSGGKGGATSGGRAAGGRAVGGRAAGGQTNGGGGAGGDAQGGTLVGSGGLVGTGGLPEIAGASDGGPASVPGLALWLAADRGVTERDGNVTRWADLSGNEQDATQGVTEQSPRLVSASGTLPMLEFDGADDSLSLPDGFADFAAGLSYFAVVEVLGMPVECTSMLQLSNGSELDDIDFGIAHASLSYEVEAHYFYGPEAFGLTQRIIAGVIHRANGDGLAELRVDGEYLAAEASGTPIVKTRYDNFIGRTLYTPCSPFEGRIGELLLYDRALAEGERVAIEKYLKDRWE